MPLSKMDVLTKVREHFSRPGSQFAVTHDASCVYRMNGASDPVRCAMGVCIPDKLYSHTFEGRSASDLWINEPQIRELFEQDEDMPTFLLEVQAAHDDAADDFEDNRVLLFDALDSLEEKYELA